MVLSGKMSDKKILLVDKELKNKNDRTWCFWETGKGIFEPVVYKQWQQVYFNGDDISTVLPIAPYTYKMIRGIDFYNYCFNLLEKYPNVEILTGNVSSVLQNKLTTTIHVDGIKFTGDYLFNSILPLKKENLPGEINLLQHFKGWLIETDENVFDDSVATLMDFRVPQHHGTTFTYVMPLSPTKALVEYTLFTKELLIESHYDEGLKNYIRQQLQIKNYNILEEEFGIIPMTNYAFSAGDERIINIGTAGGQTKASSGYTFRFIQKHSQAIVSLLLQNKSPLKAGKIKKRFRFYDHTLLHILYHNQLPGKKIFSLLFNKNKASRVLQFLDNDTGLGEELKIISTLPTTVFFKAALKQF